MANDEAKKAHRRDFDQAKAAGETDGDYEPLVTTFDLAVRWLQMFLQRHRFTIPTFFRWLHSFLDFSGINISPALAKRNCAFFFGSSNSGVSERESERDRERERK